MINNISDIKYVFYINLQSRPDRKKHVEKQLQNIGINSDVYRRFNAVQLANGAIGCSLSHLHCLQIAKRENLSHIMIVEDDIHFKDANIFKTQFNRLLHTQHNWDAVLLAGNNVGPYQILSDCAVHVSQCQTTTGYLVKSDYFDTLIENYRAGIKLLMENPQLHSSFAIDKYWFKLQMKDLWLLVYPLVVTQLDNYSDILKRFISYDPLMLRLDK